VETGRVGEVERLLQVVTVLRTEDGLPVSRDRLVASVDDYRTSSADPESLKKMIERDLDKLREIGIEVENVAGAGDKSTFRLVDGAWRLPIDLSPLEESLLAWVMAAAGAASAEANPLSTSPEDLSSLLGTVPRHLDIAQAAIAGRRRLLVDRDGEETEFEPSMLASRVGRWFVLGKYVGDTHVKGPRLDRLAVLGLGGPADPPYVEDPDVILDPTAWEQHEQRDAELRCRTEDLGAVRSWFPRAEVVELDGGESALRFWVRNETNLIDRVLGLGGATWIVAPESASTALRERVQSLLEQAAS
jgi:predicted DNA-binding transcriptional regulator YafY